MKENIRMIACAWTAALLAGACTPSEEQQVSECAEEFALAYFNMDFDRAAGCCTPESGKWLAFRASNITSADVEAHNAQSHGIHVYVEGMDMRNDSSADVRCLVTDAVTADSLEDGRARVAARRTWLIQLVRRNGKWSVKMEAPLQSAE